MKHLISILLLSAALPAGAKDFSTDFEPKTLRLDYIMGGDSTARYIMLAEQAVLPQWAGRRTRLKEVPVDGDAQIIVRDKATGDTLYRQPFATLYNEWLTTPEVNERPRSFEVTMLTPLPKREALIDVVLFDNRRQPMLTLTHPYRPDDVLIAHKGERTVTPHRYLHRSSHPESAIDVAIIGEGYAAEELDSFYTHAQRAVDAILSFEPYTSHADDFNFVAVGAVSPESGVSIPRKGEWRNAAFGSHFSTFYSDRYLTTPKVHAVHDALAGIPYEHIIILANTPEYGGGGFFNTYLLTSARHRTFRPVTVHEFGHSFAGLADEYFYEGGDALDGSYPFDVEPWAKNITTMVDFDSKWKDMLPKGTPVPTDAKDAEKYPVGVYEGGGYQTHGIYRPADECRMRNNTYPTFCPVCRRALEEVITFYTE